MRISPVSMRSAGWQGIGFFLLALVAAYEVGRYIVKGDFLTLFIATGGAVVCVVAVVVLNNWRHGVYIFVVWLVLEDLIRKYLGNNIAVYFGKDVLLVILYVAFLAA
ncbi:MAG TPA: hypothetical protein VEH49_06550, partial [Methylomirabilota bacterium]|nr:hypothetical protein [Methylomirabilota bacterium]